jgi:hypothetical protein
VQGEIHENEVRANYTPSERVAIERAVAAEIEKRQGQRSDLQQDFVESDPNRVANESARLAGFGNRETARQARAVVEAAEQEPEKFGRLLEEMDGTGRVNGVYRRLVVARKAEAISAEPPPLSPPERRHSRKPEEFYQLVESLCPGSKLELFCRHPRPGWTAHGDELAGEAA